MYRKYLMIEKQDKVKSMIIEKTERGNLKQEVEIDSLYSLLELFNKTPKYVKGLKIKGNDLFFTTNDLMVQVKDYKKFKNNKHFSFLFCFLNNKKYKVVREVAIKGTALGIASMIIVSMAGTFITNVNASNPNLDEEKINIEGQDETTITKPYINMTFSNTIDELKKDNPSQKKEKVQNVSNAQISEETTVYDELGIGSRSNDEKAIRAKELYYSKIQRYAKKYGLDPDIVCAIATQERGIHSSVKDSGGAIGLMQIQVSVWHDKTIEVFDYEENKTKMIYITEDKLKDIDFNIEVGCAVFQDCLNHMKGNVIAALQSYNTGPYAVDDIIKKYCNVSGKTKLQILQENDLNWLDYRTSDYNGDPDYVEHVLSYFNGDIASLQVQYNSGSNYIK